MRTVLCPPDGVACRVLSKEVVQHLAKAGGVAARPTVGGCVPGGGGGGDEFAGPVDHGGGQQDEVDGFGGQRDAMFDPGEGERVVDQAPGAMCFA